MSDQSTLLKRFLCNLFLFFLVQAAVFFLLLARFNPDAEENYLAATVDKHRRLAQTRPPRVILVGGSNLALGIQSDRLEVALGQNSSTLRARRAIERLASWIPAQLSSFIHQDTAGRSHASKGQHCLPSVQER